MLCPHCSSEVPENTKYCTNCGGELPTPQSIDQPTYEAPQPEQPVYEAPQAPVNEAPQQPAYAAPQPEQPPVAEQPVYAPPQPPVNEAPQYQPQQPTYQQPAQAPQGQYYQPPQGGQPIPPYGSQPYGQQPYQAPVEDKVSVGLVILSVFIPLVGLILFITQRKTKPKNAKACGLAALIAWIVGIVISIIAGVAGAKLATDTDNWDSDTYSFEDWEEDGDIYDFDWDTEDTEEGAVYGFVDSFNDYNNDYFNFYFSVPTDFTISTADEMAEVYGAAVDTETGMPTTTEGDITTRYEYRAYNDYGSSVQVVTMENNSDELLTMDEFIDSLISDTGYTSASQYYDVELAGQTVRAVDLKMATDAGEAYDLSFFVFENNGNFAIVGISVMPDHDDSTVQDYADRINYY